jgi:superfamily II DNA/RNA helicase
MQPNFSLDGLEMTSELAAAFARDAIETPTDVQKNAFPLVASRRHVALKSGTGTGKTLAYLLPLLQRAKAEPTFRVVVMAPNPELAVQILRTVEAYKDNAVKCLGLVGGGNPERQKDKLKKHPQIMVGTPGRVLELIFARKIKTAQIGTMVLDEIDEILSPQNEEPLHEVCGRPEFTAQVLCVSATLGERAQLFMEAFMKEDRALAEGSDATLSDCITHELVHYEQQRKEVA